MAYLVAVTERSLNRTPLELTAFCVRGEPISYADAIRGQFTPIKSGDAWGPPWSTTWFHVRGRVPEAWLGRRVVAQFDLGFAGPTGFTCEALAWNEGKPWRGVDPNHRWLPIHGPEVDFYLEAAANPRATEHGVEPAPSMLALREAPEPAFILREAVLAIHKPDSAGVGEASLAHSHKITAVGHANIDTAWEWPLREAKRKVARSWSTQLALMDEYPDYVFAASQPAQYQWMKETYPDIYRRIKEKVAAGQWEPVGAMWVEADCNLPSGESLVRQLLHGKRFFMREFGYETRVLWLPDVFGYPGNLPQLMAAAGCDFFLTQKLSWNDTNKPEHHTFMWEGIDGTGVFTHFPPADTYNGDFSAAELEMSIRNFKDAPHSNRSLYLFGFGDGGGGPTADMIESARQFGVQLGHASEFFARASVEAKDLTTAPGELYFELHRGTYTSQSRTKWWNRRAQMVLRDAEMWSVGAGDEYPRGELEAMWKTALLNQFHDLTDLEAVHLDPDAVRFVRRFGESQLWQRMVLDWRVLRFETQVDWHERHKMLKVAFPVTISSPKATYEVQFGHVERPTHWDTPKAQAMFEVCAQRWAHLGDGDYGVALLNDSKHGHDIRGSVMRLSLLRGPTHPDPTADQGMHTFTYALMPHPGDFRQAGVIQAAEDLNSPLRVVPTNLPTGTSRSLVEVDTPQVVVEAIKRAEDSEAVIVRLYEAWGRSCTARIRTTLPASRAFLCDLLERNIEAVSVQDGVIELELSPFKILTLKLEP